MGSVPGGPPYPSGNPPGPGKMGAPEIGVAPGMSPSAAIVPNEPRDPIDEPERVDGGGGVVVLVEEGFGFTLLLTVLLG